MRRGYSRLCRDVDRGGVISGRCMPARNAEEQRLRLSVGTIDGSAARAGLARVGGIDCDHRNADQLGFVSHKSAKLGEAPRMQAVALTLSGLHATADVGEVFNRNRQSRAFSPRNEFLADAVVHVGAEPGFLSGELAQTALGRLGAATLQPGLAAGHLGTERFNGCTAVAVAEAVKGQIDDAEIDAENALDVDFLGVGDVADAGDVPLALDQHQIGLTLTERQQLTLAFSANERDHLSAFERPDADRIVALETEDTVIERLGSVLAEAHHLRRTAVGFVSGVGIGHLGDAAYRDLRCDTEALARRVVRRLVQVELTGRAGLEPSLRHPIAGIVAAFKRRREQLGLRLRRLQLDVGNELHVFHTGMIRVMRQDLSPISGPSGPLAGETAIPPRPERRGFSRRYR